MTTLETRSAACAPSGLLRWLRRLALRRFSLMAAGGVLAIVAAACSSALSGDAPPVSVQTFEHGDFSLDNVQGKAVVVNFWFPSCPPCEAELPDLQAAYEEHRADGVEFIGVQLLGLDTAEDGARFLKDRGITYPAGPDTDDRIWRAYKVTGFPTTVFLDRKHNVVKTWAGLLDRTRLEEFIGQALES